MTLEPQRLPDDQNPSKMESAPNVALIAGAVVAALALVFILKNGQAVTLNFLVYHKTTTVRWALFLAMLFGAVLSKLFGVWRRRRRER